MTREEIRELILKESSYKGTKRSLERRLSRLTDEKLSSFSYLDVVLYGDNLLPYDLCDFLKELYDDNSDSMKNFVYGSNPFLKMIK